jgi:hypothetical protein
MFFFFCSQRQTSAMSNPNWFALVLASILTKAKSLTVPMHNKKLTVIFKSI